MKERIEALGQWLKGRASEPAFPWAVTMFLAVRVSLSLLAIVIICLRPIPQGMQGQYLLSYGILPETSLGGKLLLAVWQRWDVIHYQRIAQVGYSLHLDRETNLFHPPLFPLLMRFAGDLLAGNYLLAGMIVSNVGCFLSPTCLYELTERVSTPLLARRTVVYLSIFPTAFFLFVPYAESLFLLFILLAFYAAFRDNWCLAGIAGALATVTRLQGIVLVVPLSFEYLRRHRSDPRSTWHDVLWLGLIPLTFAGFLLFLKLTNPVSMPGALTSKVLSTFGGPWEDVVNVCSVTLAGKGQPIDVANLVFALFFLYLTVGCFKEIPRSYSVYMMTILLTILLKVNPLGRLEGGGRYGLTLFPGFMVMGTMGANPLVNRLIAYG